MASVFQDAVSEVLVQQPWWERRKDSIAAATGSALQVVNLSVLLSDQWPAWVNLLAATLIGVAQIIIHATTRGAITPSMAGRLEEAAHTAHLDRPGVSAVRLDAEPVPDEPVIDDTEALPVYVGESTGEYVGEHRALDGDGHAD